MAQITIPELPESITLDANYAFPIDSGIQSYKVKWSTLLSFIWNAVIGTFTEATSINGDDLFPMELDADNTIRKIKASTIKAYVTENALPPIGTVIPFFDFNGVLTYDTNVWKPVNGATVSDAGSPLNGIALPNMTGRALLGYGTEGGSDMISTAWSTSPVGNSNHTVSVAHTHGLTSAYAKLHMNSAYTQAASISGSFTATSIMNGYNVPPQATGWGSSSGSLSSVSCVALGGNTDGGGSSSVDIRMRSIRCRWLVRFK